MVWLPLVLVVLMMIRATALIVVRVGMSTDTTPGVGVTSGNSHGEGMTSQYTECRGEYHYYSRCSYLSEKIKRVVILVSTSHRCEDTEWCDYTDWYCHLHYSYSP